MLHRGVSHFCSGLPDFHSRGRFTHDSKRCVLQFHVFFPPHFCVYSVGFKQNRCSGVLCPPSRYFPRPSPVKHLSVRAASLGANCTSPSDRRAVVSMSCMGPQRPECLHTHSRTHACMHARSHVDSGIRSNPGRSKHRSFELGLRPPE